VASEVGKPGPPRSTTLDLEGLVREMAGGPERFWISEEAGGYVCEWTYHGLLERAAARGIPGLFVHVPHARRTPVSRQTELLRRMVLSVMEAR
jgi:pyrrolidone-carboxylate peptidase